jgi:hypothetical protein
MHVDFMLIRTVFTIILIIAGYFIQPVPDWIGEQFEIPGGSRVLSALAGLVLACGIIFFEVRIRQATLKTLIGAAIGSILGIINPSNLSSLLP